MICAQDVDIVMGDPKLWIRTCEDDDFDLGLVDQ